jgi:ribose transport system ATP-binding protein
MSLAVEFREAVKAFGPVRVLHGVSLALQPGRIYGLLGENGAGKSTLMKILGGYEGPDGRRAAGRRRGATLQRAAPGRSAGHRADPPGVQPGRRPDGGAEHLPRPRVEARPFPGRHAHAQSKHAQALAQVGLQVDPGTRVRHLIVAEKQLVEIARALARNARLLIMDEPTATLTPGETERLFELMASLKALGTTIIYISHKLDEVERTTDEVIVMRDGKLVAREPTPAFTRREMANLMVGRELADLCSAQTCCTAGRAGPQSQRPGRARLGGAGEL